jgi:DNA repair protein RadC
MGLRETLATYGAAALTNLDLLAVLIGNSQKTPPEELARRLVDQWGSIGKLDNASVSELAQLGLGQQAAAQVKAALALHARLHLEAYHERVQVRTPADIANLCRDMAHLEQEELRVLCLDTKNVVIGMETIYRGSVHSTVSRTGELYRAAIRRNASAIVILHNHPSGDATPSPEDAAITREFVKAGALLDIDMLDHVVIGRLGLGFVSMKERRLGFDY